MRPGDRRVRVAVIDSGVNPTHPHVIPIAGGISVTATGLEEDFTDFIGHGTAVAGAIREKSAEVGIYAAKIFDRTLATSSATLLRALDWCLDERMDFINLSLGTLNVSYASAFETRMERAASIGCRVVSAYEINGQPALPGSLAGAIGVVLDPDCVRTRYIIKEINGRTVYAASGYPRSIPGVPPERNLQGVSFSVANVTGLLAAAEVATACQAR